NSAVDTSPTLHMTTMDTMSHNFTWQIDTLGVTSSVLYDVAIINDTLAYAVGEMYLRDSAGQIDPQVYNMAKWNGVSWQLMRIQFYTICGQASRTPYPASAVFAFSPTDIWIAMRGDQVARWNGSGQTATMCLPVSFTINKLWGESSNSVYAVGNAGNIMHYNGSAWQRVESGTTIEISDIYGSKNPRTDSLEILAVAGNPFVDPQRKILQINGSTVIALSDNGITRALSGIWFAPGKRYWVVGDGLWYSNSSSNSFNWQNKSGVWTPFHLTKVRGNDVNDVFMVGSYSEVLHFNGVTPKSLRGPTGTDGLYWSVAVKGDQIMAVGQAPPRAVVLRGMHIR
ncbi:MAG: glucosyl transferase, partial [bacterium]